MGTETTPKEAREASKRGPRGIGNAPERAQRHRTWPKTAPQSSSGPSRARSDPPKKAQESPESPKTGPKTAPRGPQMGSRRRSGGSKERLRTKELKPCSCQSGSTISVGRKAPTAALNLPDLVRFLPACFVLRSGSASAASGLQKGTESTPTEPRKDARKGLQRP